MTLQDSTYLIIAVMCLGQCFLAVMFAAAFFTAANYLSFMRHQLVAKTNAYGAPMTINNLERRKKP